MIVGFCRLGKHGRRDGAGWAGEVGRDAVHRLRLRARRASSPPSSAARRVDSNAELAERADLVVLAVKPARARGGGRASWRGAEAGRLAARRDPAGAASQAAFPERRRRPGDAERRGRGAAAACSASPAASSARRCGALLELLGHVVELPDAHFDAATAVMGCAPAYLALAVEALADAGADAGLDEELARELVVETTAGTGRAAARSATRPTCAARSPRPGGSTEAGLEALDREGAREAFEAAVRASLERMRGA